ncbi:MAG TPA: hypothetical protein VH087_06875 [Thermoanaerobaculia bacterium]|jgi:hypothetical protein|nr:hypothetical protein [Thermoanaerobaculia bacterium]
MPQDTPLTTSGFGAPTATEICPTCGQSKNHNRGLEQFLGRLGVSEEMISNLKTQMQNVDMEQYLNTARDYLNQGTTKATAYAKENPAKVAAGVAALAVGAGLLISTLNRE